MTAQMHVAADAHYLLSLEDMRKLHTLEGKKGIIFGLADEKSIAFGCALAAKALGAEIGLACYSQSVIDKLSTKGILSHLCIEFTAECNFKNPDDISQVFAKAAHYFGNIDFVIYSAAGGAKNEIQGNLMDASEDGMLETLTTSAFPILKIARESVKVMSNGGVILSMGYLGEERVVDSYHYMAPVKAFLASAVKNLSAELGKYNIRINDVSPAPIKTRAASGLKDFDTLVQTAIDVSPLHRAVTNIDVGHVAAAYLTDAKASITGETIHVDGGFHAIAFASVKSHDEIGTASVVTSAAGRKCA